MVFNRHTLMIEKNLGNLERVVRLAMAVFFMVWATSQETMNGIEIMVVIIAALLMLNGIFSRCYFWYLLDLNTNDNENSHCH